MYRVLRPPSVVRSLHQNLCRNYLRTYYVHFFQISVTGRPIGLNQGGKWHFWKKKNMFSDFLWIFQFFLLTLYPMGAKISKRYSSFKSLLNCFNFIWIFFSVVLTEVLLWTLKFWVFYFSDIFVVFVNMGENQPYSRLSTTHGHITDCKLDSVVCVGVCEVI